MTNYYTAPICFALPISRLKKSHEACILNRIVLFTHSLSSHVDIDVLACRIELEYGIILLK